MGLNEQCQWLQTKVSRLEDELANAENRLSELDDKCEERHEHLTGTLVLINNILETTGRADAVKQQQVEGIASIAEKHSSMHKDQLVTLMLLEGAVSHLNDIIRGWGAGEL